MYRVLIVDDEPIILEGLKHIISWESFDMEIVAEANYGLPALEIIENNKIDILITDIKMPFMDGLELIKKVREKNHHVRIIVLSGFNDFEYVRTALKFGIENYLLKPVSEKELIATLENIIKKIEKDLYEQIYLRDDIIIIKNNILYRWLTNNIDKAELIERAKFLNIDLSRKKYYVVICKIGAILAENRLNTENKSALSFSIQNTLIKSIGSIYNFIAFPDLDNDIVLIFYDTPEFEDIVLYNKIFPECIATLRQYLYVDTFFTIGNIQKTYDAVYRSYTSAKNLQNYRLIYPDRSILSHKHVIDTESHEKVGFQDRFNTINTFVTLRNRRAAVDAVKDFFNFLKTVNSLTPSIIHGISMELLFSIINTTKFIKNNAEVFQEFTEQYTNVLKMETMDQLENWMIFIVNKSIDLLQMDDHYNDSIIKKIICYIQLNYANDINLKTLSSKFNINTAYLGQLFNKELGESFTNYLNKIRVEKAKELLINSGMKTAEISVKVGYSNTNYFYTIFKKITGISPTDYKDHINKF